MIFLPAGRFAIGPLPPGLFAARFLAAVIRPPLLFFAMGLASVPDLVRGGPSGAFPPAPQCGLPHRRALSQTRTWGTSLPGHATGRGARGSQKTDAAGGRPRSWGP